MAAQQKVVWWCAGLGFMLMSCGGRTMDPAYGEEREPGGATGGAATRGGAGGRPVTSIGGVVAGGVWAGGGWAGGTGSGGTSGGGTGVGGTSSGGTGFGGTPSGGTPTQCDRCATTPVLTLGPVLGIDDFDDGDYVLSPADGRSGWWYRYDDETPGGVWTSPAAPGYPQQPLPVAGELYLAGRGFTGVYAGGYPYVGVGVNINSRPVACAFDASRAVGVSFRLRAIPPSKPGPRSSVSVRFRVATEATSPCGEYEGGSCTSGCWDHFGVTLAAQPSWSRQVVAWSELRQEGWGTAADFDPTRLFGFQWQLGSPDATEGFELYLDQIAFVTTIAGP